MWEDTRKKTKGSDAARGARVFGGRSSLVGSTLRPSGKNAISQERSPALAFNSTGGECLVVWEDTRKEDQGFRRRRPACSSAVGSRVGYNFRVSGNNAIGRQIPRRRPTALECSRDSVAATTCASVYAQWDVFRGMVSAGAARIGYNLQLQSASRPARRKRQR